MYFYYNENLLDEAVSAIHSFSQGFQFALGVFETILVLKGKPCFTGQHLTRFMNGCDKLGLENNISSQIIEIRMQALISRNNIENGRLKIICFRDVNGPSMLMTVSHYQYKDSFCEEGFDICLSDIKRNPYSPFSYIKSLNYAENILAREEAIRQGYDEALFLNVYNKICEGTISNIFWIKDCKVYTPQISCGILNGITRKQIIEICRQLKLEISEGNFDYSELLQADEVFAANSLMGIKPVAKLDNNIYDISDYRLTRELFYEYRKLIIKELLK